MIGSSSSLTLSTYLISVWLIRNIAELFASFVTTILKITITVLNCHWNLLKSLILTVMSFIFPNQNAYAEHLLSTHTRSRLIYVAGSGVAMILPRSFGCRILLLKLYPFIFNKQNISHIIIITVCQCTNPILRIHILDSSIHISVTKCC